MAQTTRRTGRARILVLLGLGALGLPEAEAAPLRRSARPVPGSFIVVLKAEETRHSTDLASREPSAAETAKDLAGRTRTGRVSRVFENALRGFALRATPEEAEAIADDPREAFVEENGFVRAIDAQPNATWGLDRIDQRNLPLNSAYEFNQTATAVHAYVIDTGIRGTHAEFSGRMGNGFTSIADGRGTSDCHGHGTHVAGTVGGTTWGVAKGVAVHPVRVLDCGGSGTTEGVVAGVDWVTANHVKPAVANMSLGGPPSDALDLAVANSVAAGIPYSVAAGNDNVDACSQSPARTQSALTVGATDRTDRRASFSNFGTCLDLFGPGVGITSSWNTSDTATSSSTGTSCAAPHVAGVAALYLELNGTASPAEVAEALLGQATPGKVVSPAGSANLLLYSRFGVGTFTLRNSASFAPGTAPDSISTGFGTQLASGTLSAPGLPLPTVLGDTSVSVGGVLAGLFFVSPNQINFHVPASAAVGGRVGVRVLRSGAEVSQGTVEARSVSPGVFTVSLDGRGVPAAQTTFDGIVFESVANPDGSPRPIDVGTQARPNNLVLYATGVRRRSNLSQVTLAIGEVTVPAQFAGAQGNFVGLDQVNARLPLSLRGRGVVEAVLTVEGREGNRVTLSFAP